MIAELAELVMITTTLNGTLQEQDEQRTCYAEPFGPECRDDPNGKHIETHNRLALASGIAGGMAPGAPTITSITPF